MADGSGAIDAVRLRDGAGDVGGDVAVAELADAGHRPAIGFGSAAGGDALHVLSEAGEPDAAEATSETIEPGRALALADFAPPALGAGERLIRMAYRAGIPAGALQSPFRKSPKPRLLATVSNPLPGHRPAGTALRAGHFLCHGAKFPIADIDFSGRTLTPSVERMIHGFRWLDDLAVCAPREACLGIAERVFLTWLAANPKPGKGPGGTVDHTAHRLLNWLIHAPLLLSSNDKRVRGKVLTAMGDTARWLDFNAGKGEDRLAEVAAWCALIAAGLLLPEGKPRRLFAEAGLMRALGELVGDDGGVLSRSPLLQMEAIALLVRLSACYRATRRDPPEQVSAMLGLLLPPLLGVLHGDGGLAGWQGAGGVSAQRIEALVAASGVRTRPLKDARQWGYQRVSAGPPKAASVLLVDAAPPPMARHARDGCASTLAFEFSHGAQRIIVNCGGASFAGGLVPVRLAQGLRATAAHSTLALDDSNSTAVHINGRLGAGVSTVELDRRAVANENGPGATRIDASHDGYAARYGLTHRRILMLRDSGGELLGQDMLVPTGRKGKRGKVSFAMRFHLARGVEAFLSEDEKGAALALPDGSHWQFRSADATIGIEDSLWVDGQGRPHGTRQLVVQGLVSRGGGTFSWLLKKMG